MRLNNEDLYNFFSEINVKTLYHANTIRTALTYFEVDGLLSRGAVENLGLVQTRQSSDEADKVLNVWNDIFLDSTDLHTFFRRQNYYGPVVFELDVDLVKNTDYEVWVTKNNPIYWAKDSSNETRYFQDVTELREKWHTYERQKKMITIRNNNSPILFDFVRKVIVDDPRINIPGKHGNDIHVFNESVRLIKQKILDGHVLKGKFMSRDCENCWCRDNYLKHTSATEIEKLFL